LRFALIFASILCATLSLASTSNPFDGDDFCNGGIHGGLCHPPADTKVWCDMVPQAVPTTCRWSPYCKKFMDEHTDHHICVEDGDDFNVAWCCTESLKKPCGGDVKDKIRIGEPQGINVVEAKGRAARWTPIRGAARRRSGFWVRR
jgi:hypothetical protein